MSYNIFVVTDNQFNIKGDQMNNKEIYRTFADTLETKARDGADSRDLTRGSFAWMFGYTLGTLPHLLENLNLSDEQVKVLEEYWVNFS
jgi:hypothetical protein